MTSDNLERVARAIALIETPDAPKSATDPWDWLYWLPKKRKHIFDLARAALSAIPVPSPMGEELLGAECDCAEVDGENPDCPVHELTIDRIARWEDWECTTTELDGFTARKVARKALGIKEVR